MLAQEVEAADEDDLLAPTEDEAQNDKAEEAAGDVGGAEPEECEAEEAVPRRVLPDPGQPTQSQLEDHRVDHYPYRSWCPECVAGRATGEQHRARRGERAMPVFGFDYLFITKSLKVVRSLSEGDEVLLKVLVAIVSTGKAVFAHTVDAKGPGEDRYAVQRRAEDI